MVARLISSLFFGTFSVLRKSIQPELTFRISACFNFVKIPTTATSNYIVRRSFQYLFSFKAKKFLFNYFFRILSLFLFTGHFTIFIMPAVITEKSRHVSNQSQRAILPEVTCAILLISLIIFMVEVIIFSSLTTCRYQIYKRFL